MKNLFHLKNIGIGNWARIRGEPPKSTPLLH